MFCKKYLCRRWGIPGRITPSYTTVTSIGDFWFIGDMMKIKNQYW